MVYLLLKNLVSQSTQVIILEKEKIMYQFTEDICIGIKEIDEEHEGFFSLINEAQAMLDESGIEVKVVATEVVKRLKDYAITHFAHEEAYMKEIRDPELINQRIQHDTFRHRIHNWFLTPIDDSDNHSL